MKKIKRKWRVMCMRSEHYKILYLLKKLSIKRSTVHYYSAC